MKNFVVPVDFTESSIQTALIAAELASTTRQGRLILYNVFESTAAGVDGTPLADDSTARRTITEMAFENLKTRLHSQQPSLDIAYYEEQGSSLAANLEKFVQRQQSDFIVIGVSEGSDIENFLMGSHAIDITKRNVCPVIIIPPNARYKGVQNILFASDFKDVRNTTPTQAIRGVLSAFDSRLHVVHLYQTGEEQPADLQQAKAELIEMLVDFRPEFHVLDETDFIGTIGRLVQEQNIDMILTVPRTHSFFSNLFSTGRTRKLAYQSPVPVIAVHE